MKFSKIIAAAAIAFASVGAFAQSTLTAGAQQSSDNNAAAQNLGVSNSTVIQSSSSPFSYGTVFQHVDTNQAAGAGNVWASPGNWKCGTAGKGLAMQFVGFGFNASGAAGEALSCAKAFEAGMLIDAEKIAATEGVTSDTYKGLKSIICQVDSVADAYETMREEKKCQPRETYKERVAREQKEGKRVNTVLNAKQPEQVALLP